MGSSSSHNQDTVADPVADPITLFSAEDITDMIKDSAYYNPIIEINPLIFEEIRYKIASYLKKMIRNIEILKKYSPNSYKAIYSNSPQKLYFPKKAIQEFSNQKLYSDLLQENLEYYIAEVIDGALIIQKNNELMPGDIHTYALSLLDTIDRLDPLDKTVDLTQSIKTVLFEISPESSIDQEAIHMINRLLNELAHRILSIAKKLANKITTAEMNVALEIVFETDTLRHHALLSKILHFSPSKVLKMVSYPISEDALASLTSVLEYITAEILNVSNPITEEGVIQGIQNDRELDIFIKSNIILFSKKY